MLVLDGDPIATFISQEVLALVDPSLEVVYLTGIADSLTYLQQKFSIDNINPEEDLQLLLLGQTLDSLEFLKQLYACKYTNCDRLHLVVHIRFSRMEEAERLSKYKVNAYYTDLLNATLIEKIIMDFNSSQSSRRLTI